MNRLKSISVKDFRSISGQIDVPLDAPIVLIHGANGAGKTSLLSAMELALTGDVPSLGREESEYLSYLPHKGRPFGEVRLNAESESGLAQNAILRVTGDSVSGTPLLSGQDASFFSERSYLAQATLGRLLEIYQYADRKSDSPLTRFVKELLGLDRIDSLIDGLHSAGNIRRLKRPVPAYGDVRERISTQKDQIKSLKQREGDLVVEINALDAHLRDTLLLVDPSLADTVKNLADLEPLLRADREEAELGVLVRAKRETDISRESWESAADTSDATERVRIEANNQAAQTAVNAWDRRNRGRVEKVISCSADLFSDISFSSGSTYSEQTRVLIERIRAELSRVSQHLTTHYAAISRRDELAEQLVDARKKLAGLDEEIATAVSSNESVVKALSQLKTEIHDETCPVCDRDFSEVSKTSLARHVTAKLTSAVEHAGRLQSLTQTRRRTSEELTRLGQEQESAVSSVLSKNELTALEERKNTLETLVSQLAEERQTIEVGDRLRAEANRAARDLLTLEHADQSMIVLRKNLEEWARRFQIATRKDSPTAQLLETVQSHINEREVLLTEQQEARRSARAAVASLKVALENQAKLELQRNRTEQEVSELERKKSEADELIRVAKDLARDTRQVRARIVRTVFNEELNTVWQDLFVRLAPHEPFIPAFAIPDTNAAKIEAVLETHYRRGGKGGDPRAMLSAGNLNTAALTLFLALHLSVEKKLPWLVIDDPVQSMDEVHIAQFAALLRMLSKQMGRQVLIAVHERPLFDYLALELSPAFEGDQLNLVELSRDAEGKTSCRTNKRFYTADRAIAV